MTALHGQLGVLGVAKAQWHDEDRGAEHAARNTLAASIAAGNPLSQRQVMTRFGLSGAAERTMRQAVTAGSNGHAQLGAEHIQEDN